VVKMCKDVWEALDWHCDAQEALRNELARKLEDGARKLQFCEDVSDVVECLVELLNDLAKVLKVEE